MQIRIEATIQSQIWNSYLRHDFIMDCIVFDLLHGWFKRYQTQRYKEDLRFVKDGATATEKMYWNPFCGSL